ncbi:MULTISPECIES: TolB family protein [Brevibacillus]|uniref:DUF5050 domain-containing protein n=1 Tax=Brevibacillus brevis TaxID=1393 RepID=A0A2Z4MLF6_BREBE|nr:MULTISPECIES: hypothetical protein [Brevibacillus]AWX57223.1 hypothetical protein AB432_020135 [Brevibacillus brevis]NRR21056.1 hypothetical protein [Brevibacillus sp. MS2.2]
MKRQPIQGMLAAALLVTSLWSGTPALAYSIGDEEKIDGSQPSISSAGYDIAKKYAVWIVEGGQRVTLYNLAKGNQNEIGDKESEKTNPKVDGDYVVWMDSRDGGSDVYLYDIVKEKEIRLTSGSASVDGLEIADKNVVWTDNGDVYLHKISTGDTEIVSASGKASNPVVSSGYVAWEDDRNGNDDIYYYDIKAKEEKAAVIAKGDQGRPSIFSNQIVYEHQSAGDLYSYSISNGRIKQLTDDSNEQQNVHLYQEDYVYSDNNDLKYRELGNKSGKKIASNLYGETGPKIYGDFVLFAKKDSNKKLQLHLYDLDEKELVPIGNAGGEPKEPSAHDRYVAYVTESKKNNTVVFYDVENKKGKVVSNPEHDSVRPVVSSRYVVWYDEHEDALFSYDIRKDTQKQITHEDDDQEPSEKLYEIDGERLLWVNTAGRSEVIITDLSTGKHTEVTTVRKEPLSVDIYKNYASWVVEEGSKSASIVLYDIEEDDETEIRDNVKVEKAEIGDGFVVWSEDTGNSKTGWDLYYYNIDRQRVNPLLRYADGDQKNPQASRNMILYEDNRLSTKGKEFYYELYDFEEDSYSDIEWDDDAEMENVRIGGNRVVWVDKRDKDPYVYTVAFAPGDDDDDDEEDED